MTDFDRLLAAIRENPGEDAPRLVWADWLEENARTAACEACKGCGKIGIGNNGNPYMTTCDECHGTGRVSDGRAELAAFVRVQCELAARDDERCRCRECQPTGQHTNGPCRSPLKPRRIRELEEQVRALQKLVKPKSDIPCCVKCGRWMSEHWDFPDRCEGFVIPETIELTIAATAPKEEPCTT